MTQRDLPDGFEAGDVRLAGIKRRRSDLEGRVSARRAEIRETERAYAMGLAMLRKAADLTQVELAEQLGVTQGAIAKLERRQDLLLSTLNSYINGVGGHLKLVVEFDNGREVEVTFDAPATGVPA